MTASDDLHSQLEAAREAVRRMGRALEVEAALEVVRQRATAMTSSSELSETSAALFGQLKALGIAAVRASVGIFDDENGAVELWTTFSSRNEDVRILDYVNVHIHPVLENTIGARQDGRPYSLTVLAGAEVTAYYQTVSTYLAVSEEHLPAEREYFYSFFFPAGMLTVIAHGALSDEDCDVMVRFAAVFGLAYTRFLDLQTSEARTRAAVRQASLSRIRAEVASMRTQSDLERITPLIWGELTRLGMRFARCGVFIMDDAAGLVRAYLSSADGGALASATLPYDAPVPFVAECVEAWRTRRTVVDFWDTATHGRFWDYVDSASGGITSGHADGIPGSHCVHLAPFLQGMLYVGSDAPYDDEEMALLQAVAEVFATAFARYEDFGSLEAAKTEVERSLEELRQAQDQLVHSEKMASLGELTAGIAHEIQNPLNFVNNFSEVTVELLDELKETLASGRTDEAGTLADTIVANLERIRHHGIRADSIVKAMLQHSRSGSGAREWTDLNALVDEYARLAFHGFRARMPGFAVTLSTDLDEAVGRVEIVPQDLGRVILNLLTNAFQAVSDQVAAGGNGESAPTVHVATRRGGDRVEIVVRDNGPGIPEDVLGRIFQPFFTTKPSGQGTGLGLSLSYDIVTKGHLGEVSVASSEGEGAEFVVRLPAPGDRSVLPDLP